jgi:hypothetical protein
VLTLDRTRLTAGRHGIIAARVVHPTMVDHHLYRRASAAHQVRDIRRAGRHGHADEPEEADDRLGRGRQDVIPVFVGLKNGATRRQARGDAESGVLAALEVPARGRTQAASTAAPGATAPDRGRA